MISQPRLLPICITLAALGVMVSFVPPSALPETRPLSTLWWVFHHWGTIPCLPWGVAAALSVNGCNFKLTASYTLLIGGRTYGDWFELAVFC